MKLQFKEHSNKETVLIADFNKPTLRNNGYNCFGGFPRLAVEIPDAGKVYGEGNFHGFGYMRDDYRNLDSRCGWFRIVHPGGAESFLFGSFIKGELALS